MKGRHTDHGTRVSDLPPPKNLFIPPIYRIRMTTQAGPQTRAPAGPGEAGRQHRQVSQLPQGAGQHQHLPQQSPPHNTAPNHKPHLER